MKRFISLMLSAMLFVCFYTGCGSSSYDESSNGLRAPEEQFLEGADSEELTSSNSVESAVLEDRKLIKNVSIHAETEFFDDLMSGLDQKIAELGGYIENRNIENYQTYAEEPNREAYLTMRIPAGKLDQFIQIVKEKSNVTSTSENVDDVTLQYVDTTTKIETLEIEQDRLKELLAGAETITEILEIEARISDVTYELESYSSQLRTMDNQIDYATVELQISEVIKLTPMEEPSVWTQITEGLAESTVDLADELVDFFVWFVINIPYLILWGLIITGVTLTVRKIRKKKQSKQDKPSQKKKPSVPIGPYKTPEDASDDSSDHI